MKNLAERIDAAAEPVSAQIVPLKEVQTAAAPVPETKTPPRRRLRWQPLLRRALPALLGLLLAIAVWQIVAQNSEGIPTPLATWQAALTLFADPFYYAGPNDQGLGWNVLASLQRVAGGFALAALVGIPSAFWSAASPLWRICWGRLSPCCVRSARWPGCRSACCCSSVPNRRRPGPFSSALSGR